MSANLSLNILTYKFKDPGIVLVQKVEEKRSNLVEKVNEGVFKICVCNSKNCCLVSSGPSLTSDASLFFIKGLLP